MWSALHLWAVLLITGLAVGAGATALTPDAWAADNQAPTHIIIAAVPALDSMPFYVAKDQGYFAKRGIDADIRRFQGGPAVLEAVVAGAAQFAHAGSVPFINATAHSAPLRAVGVNALVNSKTTTMGIFANKATGIRTVRELAGHSFAINQRGNLEWMILSTQTWPKEGVSASSIKEIEIPYPVMQQAVDGGQVDAAVAFQPFTAVMKQDPKEQLLGYLDSYIPDPGYPITFAVVHASYAHDHPEIVKSVVAALDEGLVFGREHPDTAATIMAKSFKLPVAVAAEGLKAIEFPASESTADKNSWISVAAGMKKAGLIPASYDIGKYVDIHRQ